MDKRSCDSLLKGILKEKKDDDAKKNLIQRERWHLRNKLAIKHNKRLDLANQIGVKTRIPSKMSNKKNDLKLNLNVI